MRQIFIREIMNCFGEVFNKLQIYKTNGRSFFKSSNRIDASELELNPQEFMTRGDRDNLQTRTNCSPCWRGNAPNISKIFEIPTTHGVPTKSQVSWHIYFSVLYTFFIHFFPSVVSENMMTMVKWKSNESIFHFGSFTIIMSSLVKFYRKIEKEVYIFSIFFVFP